jgi:hypothetical protein
MRSSRPKPSPVVWLFDDVGSRLPVVENRATGQCTLWANGLAPHKWSDAFFLRELWLRTWATSQWRRRKKNNFPITNVEDTKVICLAFESTCHQNQGKSRRTIIYSPSTVYRLAPALKEFKGEQHDRRCTEPIVRAVGRVIIKRQPKLSLYSSIKIKIDPTSLWFLMSSLYGGGKVPACSPLPSFFLQLSLVEPLKSSSVRPARCLEDRL